MTPDATCSVCGNPLHSDEIGLTRKLINRGTEHFLCLKCLSRRFDVPESILLGKIEEFREMGCTLFAEKP